ncbi:glycosyltransferase [Lachnospiraceae bacterium OttesenSCG-928-D06]|nr:glycosyltransferase [Lachnospiraceae bacterium OttesenSCG-928-D06]
METKKQPAISVIMSIYNQKNPDYLEKAVMSVLGQTFEDFEFIIYNDGSDNGIFEELDKYTSVDERIIKINNPVNHGLAYSLNACIDVARGKYIARMDDDDICDPRRFQVQYDYMESHPEIAFVGCNAALIDKNGIWGHRQMPEVPGKEDFLKFSPYIHPTVMIRREVLEKEEAYNTSADTLRCEDYELFMRLMKEGRQGHNIQRELFYYREDDASYKKRKLKTRIAEMRIRYKSFKELNLLTPKGCIYVMRPLLSAVVPSPLILYTKKQHHKQELEYDKQFETTKVDVSGNTKKRVEAI